MKRAGLLLPLVAACSAPASTAREEAPAPIAISAGALARAYRQDARAADLSFVGHRLLIDGTVHRAASGGSVEVRAGDGPDGVLASGALATLHPGDLVVLGCTTIDVARVRVAVGGCAIVSRMAS